MLLANPAKPALLVHLPVADAISLEVGAPLKFFLTVRPLSPVSGVITETSYQASVEGDGVASYRLRASLAEKDVRIGLRGTEFPPGGPERGDFGPRCAGRRLGFFEESGQTEEQGLAVCLGRDFDGDALCQKLGAWAGPSLCFLWRSTPTFTCWSEPH